jgi:hypothetical protein
VPRQSDKRLESFFIDPESFFNDLKSFFVDLKRLFRDLKRLFRDLKSFFDDLKGFFDDLKGFFNDLKSFSNDLKSFFNHLGLPAGNEANNSYRASNSGKLDGAGKQHRRPRRRGDAVLQHREPAETVLPREAELMAVVGGF